MSKSIGRSVVIEHRFAFRSWIRPVQERCRGVPKSDDVFGSIGEQYIEHGGEFARVHGDDHDHEM